MKKTLLTILVGFLLTMNTLYSQQIPLYNQYYFNPIVYNPAMTGIGDKTNAFLINHSQWTDMPGAPVTRVLTLDGPIKEKKVGLGVSLFSDATDIIERFGANVSYSYRIKTNDKSSLLFGLSVGALDHRIDYSRVVVQDNTDRTLFNEMQRKATFDATFGAAFTYSNIELGIAVPQLFANTLEYSDSYPRTILDTRTFYNLSRHYLFTAKYNIMLNKEKNISTYPMVLMRYLPGIPLQYDINAVLNWKNMGWLGVTYRSDYAIGLNIKVNLHKNFHLGYAYDIINSSIGAYAGTSHEILLGYTFDKRKESPKSDVPDASYLQRVDSLLHKINEGEDQAKSNKVEIYKLIDEMFTISDNFERYKKEMQDSLSKMKIRTFPEEEKPEEASGAEIFKSSPSSDFVDETGQEAAKGYYIVIASFKNNAYAEKLKKDFSNKDYGIVYNEKRKWNYVYIAKPDNFKDALIQLKEVRLSKFPTAWVHILK